MTSEDFGATWSNATSIPAANAAHWRFVATGPPQGIQLMGGRLLIASDHMNKTGKIGNRTSFTLYVLF